MNTGTAAALLQLINAAVTPVVLISACAALILGVNNKHTAISDRLRLFAAELRSPATTADRRQQLDDQLAIFFLRYRLTWRSLVGLYAAVIAFVLMIVILLLVQKQVLPHALGALPLFILGIMLMLAAVIFEMMEIRLSIKSLEIELSDLIKS